MKREEVIQKVSGIKKGTFVRVAYIANAHTKKNGKDKNIVKVCYGVYRVGISYANLKQNANKETGSLNGKVWEQSFENYLLTSDKTGEEMLRVYTTKCKTHSQWFINGLETTKEELLAMDYISDTKHNGVIPCFDIKLANIISIG